VTAVEEKKTLFLISGGKKEENANSSFSRANNSHRYRDRFVNKCSNKPSETNRSMKVCDRVTNSRSNEQTFVANKERDAGPHSDLEESDAGRIKISMSEKITKNRESLNTKTTETSSHAQAKSEMEKEKKFPSKVPVRTWKRQVTKDPPVWRTEHNAPNEDTNQGYEKLETTYVVETAHRNGHRSVNPENDKNNVKIARSYATRDHSDIKGSDYFRGKINVNKSESISSNSNMRKVRNLKPKVQQAEK